MTGKWVGWAAELPGEVKGPARLAAFVLADACDPDGICTYGVKKLAKRAAMQERAFQRATASLEAMGWISKYLNAVESITVKGRTVHLKPDQRPNQYVLHPHPIARERGVESDTPSPEQDHEDRGVKNDTPSGSEPGVENDTSRGVDFGQEPPDRGVKNDTQSPYVPTGSPLSSPYVVAAAQPDTPAPAPGGADDDYDGTHPALFAGPTLPTKAATRAERFTDWWSRVPKKHERGKCEQKWAKVDMDALDRALGHYLASLDAHEQRTGVRPFAMQPLRFLNGAWTDWANGPHFNPDWPTKGKPQTAAEKVDRMDELAAVMTQAMAETGEAPDLITAFIRGPQVKPSTNPPPQYGAIEVKEISA